MLSAVLALVQSFTFTQSGPAIKVLPVPRNSLSVDASTKELATGYLKWIHAHPEVEPGFGLSNQDDKPVKPYAIVWPSLDIYDANGNLIYHGNDSAENISVIRALPQTLLSVPTNPAKSLRPTLAEAEVMFPEIATAKGSQIKAPQYTLFVINYAERPACKDQDVAIQQLKPRLEGSQILLVEVRLTGS